MSTDRTVESAVFAAVDVVNQQLPREQWLKKQADTRLVGNVSSLTLISYLVTLEELIESNFQYVSLTDDSEIMTDPDGPLRNLGELTRYLNRQLTA